MPENSLVTDDIDLSKPPMRPEDVEDRLKALDALDLKIVQILEAASSALQVLNDGKKASAEELEAAKEQFKTYSQSYYSLLEETSVELRREVREFHYASKEKVLPLTLAKKADWVAKEKENEIWQRIEVLSRKI